METKPPPIDRPADVAPFRNILVAVDGGPRVRRGSRRGAARLTPCPAVGEAHPDDTRRAPSAHPGRAELLRAPRRGARRGPEMLEEVRR